MIRRRHLLATAAFLIALPAASWAQTGSGPAPVIEPGRPAPLREVGFDQRLGAQVPLDARFRDETGRSVTLGELVQDKPVLLVPAYYECPMLCTIVLNGVVSMLRALPFDVGNQFTVVTLSFDAHETPELAAKKKEHYLGEYRRPGAAEGWHFLTGDEPEIRRVTDAVGFRYHWDEASKQFAHASGIVVLTPRGRVSHYFYGVEFPPRDLRLSLVEASDERIGSVVDALLLFCFHYDPATGRYSKVAIDAVRIGGVLTLLALGGFIVVMLRRDRMRHHPA
ncbi:MAG TPA: SCO family protein [Candidatus Binatia bacterium]|jgi:protein SCO1/2|nr:SCO family protein [Candidatus Binatia bacterium]